MKNIENKETMENIEELENKIGILVKYKEKGITSFDVIRDVRKEYSTKKVGHIGTLDPLACGVLPVLVGDATKLSDYFMEHDKEYIAELKLGYKTTTLDGEGEIVKKDSKRKVSKVIKNRDFIVETINSFLGNQKQIPPMYSAIKQNGKKLYELAREGIEVERKERDIHIYDIEVLEINDADEIIKFRVVCSKGTYIRVLCEDIAQKLGLYGYMFNLERTRVGIFKKEDRDRFITLDEVFKDKIILTKAEYEKFLNGVKLEAQGANDAMYGIYVNNKFMAVGEVIDEVLKRKVIVNTL